MSALAQGLPASTPGLQGIPAEVLETVLVFCALANCPSAIAALSKTCRFFYELIYKAPDSHLWREIFLAVFDDPRLLHNLLRRPFASDAVEETFVYDWQQEFTDRIAAKNFLLRYANLPLTRKRAGKDIKNPAKPGSLSGHFEALNNAIKTIAPFNDPNFHDYTRRSPGSLPPLTLVLSSGIPAEDLPTSRNALWIETVLERGLPRFLSRKLLPASAWDKNLTDGAEDEFSYIYKNGWDESSEGKAFYKFVFYANIRPSLGPSKEAQAALLGHSLRGTTRDQPPKFQLVKARDQARARVYNMSYLRKSRCWGPFQPLPGTGPQSDESRTISLYSSAWGDEDDGEDSPRSPQSQGREAPRPPPGHTASSLLAGSELQDDETDTDFDPEDDADDDLIEDGGLGGDGPHDMYFFPEFPHEIVPDYAYLAELRLVAMSNVKEKLLEGTPRDSNIGQEDLDALKELQNMTAMEKVLDILDRAEVLRMGSMPEFWGNGWNSESKTDDAGEGPSNDNDTEGWDWAGVAGEWRRCVCWMDYRDLISHNWQQPARSDELKYEETMRIFPMTLRVSRYERPPPPPPSRASGSSKGKDKSPSGVDDPANSLAYKLPIIHFEGEARIADRIVQAKRIVSGSVRMVGDGTVRWSMLNSEADTGQPEWTSESVQIGHIGSAVGILGFWTGTRHRRTDPLGPSWAWKVK